MSCPSPLPTETDLFDPEFPDGSAVATLDDETGRVAERLRTWRDEYQPETPGDEFLFEMLVTEATRLDRCHAEEVALRRDEADRAWGLWDVDRLLAVERIARTLPKNPEIVARTLRASRHGCQWLLERWNPLAGTPEWDDGHWSAALDLMGIPLRDRDRDQVAVDLPAPDLARRHVFRVELPGPRRATWICPGRSRRCHTGTIFWAGLAGFPPLG